MLIKEMILFLQNGHVGVNHVGKKAKCGQVLLYEYSSWVKILTGMVARHGMYEQKPIILKGKEFYINQKFVPMVIDSERKIQIGMLVYSTSKREKMESCIVNESGNFLKYDFETEEYEDFNPKANLTKTEKVILGRMEKGLSNDAIANNLNISAYTVKAHKRNIFKKLNVRNTTEALAIADRYNLYLGGG